MRRFFLAEQNAKRGLNDTFAFSCPRNLQSVVFQKGVGGISLVPALALSTGWLH